MKYLYLIPCGGFNDILSRIKLWYAYCIKYERVLLVDTTKDCYKINLSDYITFTDERIIYDILVINKILSDISKSVYPKELTGNLLDFNYTYSNVITKRKYKEDIILMLEEKIYEEDIIVCVESGGGRNNYSLFDKIILDERVKQHINGKVDSLPKPYISIQVRNTDYKCDYQSLYEKNKLFIHKQNAIYIATDDKDVLEWFKSKGLPVYNYTTYPSKKSSSLHHSNVSSDVKFIDMLTDFCIISLSDNLLSESKGGFIDLCRGLQKNNQFIKKLLT